MDFPRSARSWLPRSSPVTSSLPEKTSAAVLPENRHRVGDREILREDLLPPAGNPVGIVIAKSFARIFFRNSINNGLLLIEQPTLYDDIKEGDTVSVVMNEHIDYNGKEYPIASLPENLMDIIRAGGLVKAMRKLNGLD